MSTTKDVNSNGNTDSIENADNKNNKPSIKDIVKVVTIGQMLSDCNSLVDTLTENISELNNEYGECDDILSQCYNLKQSIQGVLLKLSDSDTYKSIAMSMEANPTVSANSGDTVVNSEDNK